MAKNKRTIIFFFVLVLASGVRADWLEDAVQVDATSGGYYKTQVRGIYTLGDLKIRTQPMGTLQSPLRISAPHISAGCGGIDLEGGSLQYLFNDFVEQLKRMASAAPAFAFQIALKTLCPECAATLQELRGIGDALNGIGLNGCQGMQAGSDWVSGKLTTFLNDESGEGKAAHPWREALGNWSKPGGWGKSLEESIKNFQTNLATLGANQAQIDSQSSNKGLTGSLIHNFMASGRFRWFDTNDDPKGENTEDILRAMSGDILGALDGNNSGKPRFIDPTWNNDSTNALLEGGTIKGRHAVFAARNPSFVEGVEDREIKIKVGVKAFVTAKMTSVLGKIVASMSGQLVPPLNNEELAFINSMPLPLYKILNTQALAGANVDSQEFLNLCQYLARLEVNAMLLNTTSQIQSQLSRYNGENSKGLDEKIQKWRAQLRTNLDTQTTYLYEQMKNDADRFTQIQNTLYYSRQLDQEILRKLANHGIYSRKAILGI